MIVLLLLQLLFIDCFSISDLHLSWSEVCLEINLFFSRFLALSRIMRRYLSKKLWLWASVLAIFALYKLLNEVERGFVWRLAVNGWLGSWSILQSMFMQVLSITFSNGSKLYLVEASVSFIPIWCVNLWIERWRLCIFIIFYFKAVFSCYITARISVHIRPLFIWIERLLIGCVSYVSKVKINNVVLDMFDNMSSEWILIIKDRYKVLKVIV